MKKILITVIVIVLLAVVGVGVYFVVSAPKTAAPGTGTGQTGTLPSVGNQGGSAGTTGTGSNGGQTQTGATVPTLAKNFGVIAADPVLDYFVSPNNTVTAIEPTGKIIQVTNGQASTLSALAINNIISASFSYNGAKALVSFGDPANPQTSVFDVATKAWAPLPIGWQSPVWSPVDYRIAYIKANANGTETFATMNIANTKALPSPVVLTTLHAQDLAVSWQTKNQITLYTKPSDYVAGSVWAFDLQKQALMPILSETQGLTTLWGPTMGLVFSVGNLQLGGDLQLVDTLGNVVEGLKFVTLPSKCDFTSATTTIATAGTSSSTVTSGAKMVAATSTSYLYCGIPRNQQQLSISHLPDDYNQKALYTSDDVYRINLSSGVIETVFADQTQNLDASDMRVINNTVFFINRYDQKLYAIQLAAN